MDVSRDEFESYIGVALDAVHKEEDTAPSDLYWGRPLSEQARCHRLAYHLERLLCSTYPEMLWNTGDGRFLVDCEYNRMGEWEARNPKEMPDKVLEDFQKIVADAKGKLTPDIILHQRGDGDSNILVIEAKHPLPNDDIEIVKFKLKVYREHMKYKYAAYVELNKRNDGKNVSWVDPDPK